MNPILPCSLAAGLVFVIGCGSSETAAPPPPQVKHQEESTVDTLLGNAPRPATPVPQASAPPAPVAVPARPSSPPAAGVLEAEAREYANYKNSSRESDWNKRLQLYVGENKGRFPASIEELASAFNVPAPKLPPGAYLSIDRTNKVVRLRGL